jgi:uncharacterized protein (TIGR03437 family)
MTNTGGGSYNYIFEIAYLGSASGWLSLNPTGGTVSNTAVRHQVTANPSGLAAGTYNANLRVLHDAPLAPTLTIPVSFSLTGPAGGPPKLSANPKTLTGAAKRGKQNPGPAQFVVSNAGGGTLAYQIASNVPWLTVAPTQGQATNQTPVTHTVTFNALNLPLGTHNGQLQITSSTPGVLESPQTVAVTVTVTPGGAISVSPAEVDVSSTAGSNEPRQIRLRLDSPDLDNLVWRASLEPANVQWLRLLDRGGTLPGTIVAEVDAASIPRPLLVTAGIVIEAYDPDDVPALGEEGAGPQQPANAIIKTIVPVRVQAVAQGAQLTVSPSRLEMIAAPGAGPRVQPISITMGGGAPALAWQASLKVRHGAGAFSLFPVSGAGAGVVRVTGNPTGLAPGVYDADVTISGGGAQHTVPVAMLVAAPGQSILSTGQTAVTLRGSAATLPANVPVVNLGAGVSPNVQVRPTTLAGTGWLSAAPSASSFRAEALGAGLTAGVRHGMLEIVAPGASNSPQYLPVVYEREEPGAAADLSLDRGGLVFVSAGGAAAPPQAIRIATNSDTALRTLVGVATESSAAWLSATPTDGQASARTPVEVQASVNPAGLAPGVHRGRLTVAIQGGPSRSVLVTLIVAPAGPCTPTSAVLTPLAPADSFRATTGHPVTVEAALIDDCGFPVAGGAVAETAGRGVMLRDMGESGGQARAPRVFRGTMQFSAAGSAGLLFRAAATGLSATERRISGTAVDGGDGATSRSTTPPVHAASFGLGRPLAPGSIATIFGTGFPSPASQPSTLPLPDTLAGFSVEIAGRPSPLFFLNSGQSNLQIPAETPQNTLVQSIVRIGQAYLPAETFFSSAAQPGLFASGARAVVVNQDGSINSALNPARRGSVVVAYLTGIGPTQPAVLTGQAAPGAEPFARPTLAATATIGGAPAEVLFLGLTPGFVGLAQANLTIGGGAQTGADVPVTIDVGGYRAPELLIAVEP